MKAAKLQNIHIQINTYIRKNVLFLPYKELSFCCLATRHPSLSHVYCHGEESGILFRSNLF